MQGTDIFAGVDGTGTESDVFGATSPAMQKRFGKDVGESAGPTGAGRKDWEHPGLGKTMEFADIGANIHYARTFLKGNVYTLYNGWHGRRKYYQRGPEAEGFSTNNRGIRVVKWLQNAMKYNSGRIFLCGYSRGGAAVVAAAHDLKALGIPVYALLLFDAVNRTVGHSGWTSFGTGIAKEKTVIPSNVANCYHIRRHFQSGSRDFMGNCSTDREDRRKTRYHEIFIWGTHSAMGGIAWEKGPGQTASDFVVESFTGKTRVRFSEDKEAAKQSRNKMNLFLSRLRP